MSSDIAVDTVLAISRELEAQSLNSVVAGFSFAAALSWISISHSCFVRAHSGIASSGLL